MDLGPSLLSVNGLSKEYVSLNNASLSDDLLNVITTAKEGRLCELTKLTVISCRVLSLANSKRIIKRRYET